MHYGKSSVFPSVSRDSMLLPRPRGRISNSGDLQHIGTAVPVHLDRSHDHPFLTFGASSVSLRLGGYFSRRIGRKSGDHRSRSASDLGRVEPAPPLPVIRG